MNSEISKIKDALQNVMGKYMPKSEVDQVLRQVSKLAPSKGKKMDSKTEVHLSDFRFEVDQIITLSERKLSTNEYIDFLKNLGNLLIAQGEYNLAITVSQNILRLAKGSESFRPTVAYALLSFGDIFNRQGLWTESIANLKKALKLFEKYHNVEGLAKAENLLGINYGECGKLKLADAHFQNGLKYLKIN